MATFDDLVNQIDNNLDNQRDRGTAFEKMVVAYLKNEPTYKQKFSDVWMLNEVPAEYQRRYLNLIWYLKRTGVIGRL